MRWVEQVWGKLWAHISTGGRDWRNKTHDEVEDLPNRLPLRCPRTIWAWGSRVKWSGRRDEKSLSGKAALSVETSKKWTFLRTQHQHLDFPSSVMAFWKQVKGANAYLDSFSSSLPKQLLSPASFISGEKLILLNQLPSLPLPDLSALLCSPPSFLAFELPAPLILGCSSKTPLPTFAYSESCSLSQYKIVSFPTSFPGVSVRIWWPLHLRLKSQEHGLTLPSLLVHSYKPLPSY